MFLLMGKRYLLTILLIISVNYSFAQAKSVINWKDFLSRNDMVFDTLTTEWHDGAYTGNGLVGAMIYMKDSSSVRMDINRTDVRDHRPQVMSSLFAKNRLPIGHFVLKPAGKILKINARVDLWNAEIRGTIITNKGTIDFKQLTFSQTNIIYFQTRYTGDENGFSFKWIAEAPISPRAKYNPLPGNYKTSPEGNANTIQGVSVYEQKLFAGGSYTTAWKDKERPGTKDYFITVAYSQKDNESTEAAHQTIKGFSSKNVAAETQIHRKWWHDYYKQSFVTMPDTRIESFYWIQQYKMASGTRGDKPALDLVGPWLRPTPWPAYWFNLNLQLTYSPLYTANRLNIAKSLITMINAGRDNLANNVPAKYRYNSAAIGRAGGADMVSELRLEEGQKEKVSNGESELGNLTWILYYYWQHYRHSMDKQVAADLYPLLKRSINYYLHLITKDKTGKWHLSTLTHSPEYPDGTGYNTNYSLASLKWGCKTLLELNDILKQHDPLATKWKDILENLTPYPTDKNGFMIADKIPFNTSHRHYSHLLMVYPYHEINWDQPENRALISKSLSHWHSFPNALYGYSFTGGASIFAMMGNGNQARDYINQLLEKFVKPSTMYMESGPVIETPLAACATIQEMYLQYWNNTLRVFPAIPTDWNDVSFENLRTEGAFLVSAVRKSGNTKWIKLKSLKGGSISVKAGFDNAVKLKADLDVKMIDKGNGTYVLNMPEGTSAILYENKDALNDHIEISKQPNGRYNTYGVKYPRLKVETIPKKT